MSEKNVKSKLNFRVQVNRSIPITYPGFVRKVMHPELESVGPNKYNLKRNVRFKLWLSEKPKKADVVRDSVYTILKDKNLLKDCLSLADLMVIQEKGLEVFRAVFGNQAVFAWKSVVQHNDDHDLYLPYLRIQDGKLVLSWNGARGILEGIQGTSFFIS